MTDKEGEGVGVGKCVCGCVYVYMGGFNSFIISWDKGSLFLRLQKRKVGCV